MQQIVRFSYNKDAFHLRFHCKIYSTTKIISTMVQGKACILLHILPFWTFINKESIAELRFDEKLHPRFRQKLGNGFWQRCRHNTPPPPHLLKLNTPERKMSPFKLKIRNLQIILSFAIYWTFFILDKIL